MIASPGIHQTGELVERVLDVAGRDHDPGRPRLLERRDELLQRVGPGCPFTGELGDRVGIDVVDDAFVPVPHQAADEVRAHPSQSDHPKLQGRPPSRVRTLSSAPFHSTGAAAATRTGTPFMCAIPASRSRSSGAEEVSRLTFAPPAALAVSQPASWPQPCGTATVPADHLVGDQRLDLDLAVGGRDPDPVAVSDPGRRGVGGIEPGPMDPIARHQLRPSCASRSCGSGARAARSSAVGSARPARDRSGRSVRPRPRSRRGRDGPDRRRGGSCRRARPARGARRGRSRAATRASRFRLRPPRRRPKRSPSGPTRRSRSTSRRGDSFRPAATEPASGEHARGDDARSARRCPRSSPTPAAPRRRARRPPRSC